MINRDRLRSVFWGGSPVPWPIYPFYAPLRILELLYCLGVALRNHAYDRKMLQAKKLPCPVVSIGNITVGGTGKTPTVIMLARLLQDQGRHPAVLTRGYGRKGRTPLCVIDEGSGETTGYRKAGDEALLISRKLPGIPVLIGSDRFLSGGRALEEYGADILILDDGFQYRRLHRDLDIVLLDAENPVGHGRLLPAGCLREPVGALRRADMFILTESDARNGSTFFHPARRLLPRDAVLFRMRRAPSGLASQGERQVDSPRMLQDKRVFAFSGIAQPASFKRTIEGLGALLVGFRAFPDHHVFSRRDVRALRRQGNSVRAEIMLTTEKDAVKLCAHKDFYEEISVLRIETRFLPHNDVFRKVITRWLNHCA